MLGLDSAVVVVVAGFTTEVISSFTGCFGPIRLFEAVERRRHEEEALAASNDVPLP